MSNASKPGAVPPEASHAETAAGVCFPCGCACDCCRDRVRGQLVPRTDSAKAEPYDSDFAIAIVKRWCERYAATTSEWRGVFAAESGYELARMLCEARMSGRADVREEQRAETAFSALTDEQEGALIDEVNAMGKPSAEHRMLRALAEVAAEQTGTERKEST